MQNDAVVGRVLLASLHQAIAEVLPGRLEFYEPWLAPTGPGEQTLGIESFTAMLALLEQEGELTDAVFNSAGQHAAFRCFADLPTIRRAVLRALPHQLRAERVVRLIVDVLPALYPGSRFDMTRRGGTVFINIDGSPFCGPRGPAADSPSCGFYAGAVTTLLRLFRLRGSLKVNRCRASGSKSCLLMVLPGHLRTAPSESTRLDLGMDSVAVPGQPELGLQVEATEPLTSHETIAEEEPLQDVAPVEPLAPLAIGEKPAGPLVAVPNVRVVRDRAAVEARWNAIVTPPLSRNGVITPSARGPTTPGPVADRDPEARWRGL